MSRFALISAAAAAALLAACAGNSETRSASASAQTPRPSASASTTPPASPAATPAPAQTAGGYTDAQLQAYVAAGREIDVLTEPTTDAARTAYAQQAGAILQRHSIAPDTYNAIAASARTDTALADRLATIRVSNLTDAQLRSFIVAAREIDPINNGLATATPEQRTAAATQIREILMRNNIDAPTYNAIASRAQTDQTLRTRIQTLQAATSAPSGE